MSDEPKKLDDGGPAFPYAEERDYQDHDGGQVRCIDWQCSGMSKREVFAGLAMMGIVSSTSIGSDDGKAVAQMACKAADAMIAALKEAVQ